MCLIIKIPEGKIVTEDIVESALHYNADGFGYMVNGQSEKWRKAKLPHVMAVIDKYKDSELVLHFRMATDGAVNKRLAHPHKLNNGFTLMHNGVLSKYRVSTNVKDKSDTTRLVTEFINPMLSEHGAIVHAELEKEITGSKLAIMDRQGYIRTYGGLWTEHNGSEYSNTYAWDYPYTYATGSYSNKYNYAGVVSTSSTVIRADHLAEELLSRLWFIAEELPLYDYSLIAYEDISLQEELADGLIQAEDFLELCSHTTLLELYTEACKLKLIT
jgi:predicted glutamine amidotransferase